MIIELVCVSFCSLLFVTHFILHKLTHDDTKQYLVLIMFLCYAMTVVFDITVRPTCVDGCNGILLIRHFFVIASFFFAVQYVKSLFDDHSFSFIANMIQYSLIGLFVCYIPTLLTKHQVFILDDIVIGVAVVAMISYIIFIVLRWNVLTEWKKALLLSMFFTVLCFSMMEILRIIGVRYKFFLCIGLIIYMIVYEIISFRNLSAILSNARKQRRRDNNENNPFGLTKTEREIVAVLRKEVFSSKEISELINKRPETIDRHIKNIMAKVSCNNRKDIVSVIDNAAADDDNEAVLNA